MVGEFADRLVLASAVSVVAVLSGATAHASATRVASTPPPECPASSTVAIALKQRIRKLSSSVVPYGDGQGTNGEERTCIYTTVGGTSLTVRLSSGAQILAFVDAEDAAESTAATGYGRGSTVGAEVIPVFGAGNDAWAIKTGGTLAALYGQNSILITAPKASVAEMKALATRALGIPSPVDKGT